MQQFSLNKVLDYRRHLRLERRQDLAVVLADEQSRLAHRSRLEQEKRRQLEELGRLAESSSLSVDAATRRRDFVSQLEVELIVVDQQLLQSRKEIEQRRTALVQADQDVQTLERLEEKHVSREAYESRRRSEREFGEQWAVSSDQ